MKTIAAAVLTIGLTMLAVLPTAAAEPAKTESAPPVAATAANPADANAADNAAANAAAYCKNIANQAADARYARQAESLAAMTKALEERIKALEDKRAEYETWVSRRKEFLDRADESVVAIYSQMRPDAAAQQIAVMDQEAAAAILSKLQPRTASAILNEMEPTTAARLTNVMAGISAAAGATKDGNS
jgi:flagellar motility protein MotE (MotC chaperone)